MSKPVGEKPRAPQLEQSTNTAQTTPPKSTATAEKRPVRTMEIISGKESPIKYDGQVVRGSLDLLRPKPRVRARVAIKEKKPEPEGEVRYVDGKPDHGWKDRRAKILVEKYEGVMEWAQVSRDKWPGVRNNMEDAVKALKNLRKQMVKHANADPKFKKRIDKYLSHINAKIELLEEEIDLAGGIASYY